MSLTDYYTNIGSLTGYDLANQTAYLDDMLRWGLDWLMKVRSTRTRKHTYATVETTYTV